MVSTRTTTGAIGFKRRVSKRKKFAANANNPGNQSVNNKKRNYYKKRRYEEINKNCLIEEDKFWEVDEIIGRRTRRGREEYLVQWKDYDETSWEPLKNLNSMAEQAAVRYVADQRNKRRKLAENAKKERALERMKREKESLETRLRKEKEIMRVVAKIKDLAMEGKESEVEKMLSENESSSDVDFNRFMTHELNNSCVWKEMSTVEGNSDSGSDENYSWHDDTPLTAASQNGDVTAVLGLLSTGLCDPTLESSSPIDSVQHTALSAVEKTQKTVKAGITNLLKGVGEPPDSGTSCFGNFGYIMNSKKTTNKEEIARFAAEKASETLDKLYRIGLIKRLLKVALQMWPRASYSDPRAGAGRERNDFSNRMFGVKDNKTQALKRKQLIKKLLIASKTYKMAKPVGEKSLKKAIEKVNKKKAGCSNKRRRTRKEVP